MKRSETLTAKEAEFLGRVYDSGKSGLYLERADIARARRMFVLKMVKSGRLDPKRYAVLTPAGEAFVETLRGIR
ncbi:MAG: hypothetical protein ACRBN8_19785 [Nannocystales bacterium]